MDKMLLYIYQVEEVLFQQGAFSPRSRRSKLTLDVKSTSSSSAPEPEIACPMCPHKEASAAKMEEHVNRGGVETDHSEFDLRSLIFPLQKNIIKE